MRDAAKRAACRAPIVPLIPALLVLLIGIGIDRASAAGSHRAEIASEVDSALEGQDEVPVVILFDVPDSPRRRPRTGSALRPAQARPARSFVSRSERRDLRERREQILARLAPDEFRLRHRYSSLNLVAGTLSKAGLERLRADPDILRVDLDEGGHGSLVQSLPLAGFVAPQSAGFTGAGVRVAIIDSGADLLHPDLAGDIVAEQCFCSGGGGCCPGGGSTQSGLAAAQDDNGHGSHVTGVVTSSGTQSPLGGAPDAEIVAVKVLDQNNVFCCTSDVIMALDWVLDQQPEVDIVNLSLSTNALYAGACDEASATTMALAAVVDALRKRDVVTFAASGNKASGTLMSAPACVSGVVSVGAVYDADFGSKSWSSCSDSTTQPDKVTCFSNSNETTDLFAPGSAVTSVDLGGSATTLSGTSFASPMAAACAATLFEANPGARAGGLEFAIASSPTQVTDSKNGLQFPRLDCGAAHSTLAEIIGAEIVPAVGPWGLLAIAGALLAGGLRRFRA